jgi:F0F1-type ATP synthase assembly protein I
MYTGNAYMKKAGSVQNLLKLSSAGIELSLIVALFAYGGYRLDRWLGLLPLFTIAGAFLGMALGFYRLYRLVSDDDRRDDDTGKR